MTVSIREIPRKIPHQNASLLQPKPKLVKFYGCTNKKRTDSVGPLRDEIFKKRTTFC